MKRACRPGAYKAYAVIRDLAGNEARSDDDTKDPFDDSVETLLVIDTNSPAAINVEPADQAVFKNEGQALRYTFSFDETLSPNFVPVAAAQWGDGSEVDTDQIILAEISPGIFEITISLELEDGYDGSQPDPNPDIEQGLVNDALLTAFIEVEDTIGNAGYAELRSVLVYRNSLPWTAPPVLTGTVLAEGSILLEWRDVPDADRYQLVRVDTPDEVLAVFFGMLRRDRATRTHIQRLETAFMSFMLLGKEKTL